MITKEEAIQWAQDMRINGTGTFRQAFLNTYGAGEIARDNWNNSLFTLGMEYGILLAVDFLYMDEGKPQICTCDYVEVATDIIERHRVLSCPRHHNLPMLGDFSR